MTMLCGNSNVVCGQSVTRSNQPPNQERIIMMSLIAVIWGVQFAVIGLEAAFGDDRVRVQTRKVGVMGNRHEAILYKPERIQTTKQDKR